MAARSRRAGRNLRPRRHAILADLRRLRPSTFRGRMQQKQRSILTSESLLGLPPQDDKRENVIPSVTQWSAGIRSQGICHAERSATKREHPPPLDDKIENVIPSVTQWSAGIRSPGICHAERSATKCEHPPPQDDRRGCGLRQDDTLCHCEWSETQRGNHPFIDSVSA